MADKYTHEKSLKTDPENDFLNLQKYLFITSGSLTKFFYNTGISPHGVILISMAFGIVASVLIIQNDILPVIAGAILLFYKNVLDKVDGSLARAKGLDSRRGRFYDSISDFIVTLAVFSAITCKLYAVYNNSIVLFIGFIAMIFSMLQCSYFIFYQVSFIKHTGKSTVNRLIESVTDDDIKTQDKWTTFLQRVFMLIYGWQDKLYHALDVIMLNRLISNVKAQMSNKGLAHLDFVNAWYINKPFLTLSSSLSIGTHIFLICIAAIFGAFEYYIFVNLILMNLLLILSVIYHYYSAKSRLNGGK
jgi:phosphatidylglycerophosphate synthase